MKSKNVLFSIITVLLLLIFAEVVFTLAFWIKDGPTLRLAIDVRDAPYTYFSQDLNTSLTKEKNPKKYRIALIGGSVARDLGRYYFIDSILNARLKTSCIEVLNAGMHGYVIQQEFILTQLIVQHYKPDMIIGVDGFNDMMSYGLNRYNNESYIIPPQNFRDFQVIEIGKNAKKFSSRFTTLFKNITRAVDFISKIVIGHSAYDYSTVTDAQIKGYSDFFTGVVNDLKIFCEAKNIAYYNFIQPVRFYDKNSPNLLRNNEGIERLAQLINRFETSVTSTGFGFSLTSVLDDHQEQYMDDCHMYSDGNLLMAEAISQILVNEIEKDSTFQKIRNGME